MTKKSDLPDLFDSPNSSEERQLAPQIHCLPTGEIYRGIVEELSLFRFDYFISLFQFTYFKLRIIKIIDGQEDDVVYV